MTSSIRIKRICEHCNKEFEAKTTVTRFCSKTCNSAALKKKYREANILKSDKETKASKGTNQDFVELLQHKDVFTITDTALYLSVSRQTIYNWLNDGIIKGKRITNKKVLILKADILTFLDSKKTYKKPKSGNKTITDFYTIKEIQEKFNVGHTWVFKIIKEQRIPKTYFHGKTYVSKKHIDNYFKKKDKAVENIKEWYTVEEIKDKFGLSKDQIYNRLSKFAVPKKKEGKFVKISKKHFDDIHYLRVG